MMGLATYFTAVLLAAPTPSVLARGNAADLKFRPLTPRAAAAVKRAAPRPVARRAAKPLPKIPESLKGWPIGWGLGTRQHWLEYARGRRIRRIGVGLLATGVSGLAVSLSLGITGVLATSLVGQNLSAGLLMGFGLASVILTYVGSSLLVKGNRIQNRAAVEILKIRAGSAEIRAELQLGLGSLQLGGQF